MVNLIHCGRKKFIKQLENKKLYCFGAGKYFQNFIDSEYNLPVEAVIDNYRYMNEKSISIGDDIVPIISVDEFVKRADKNSVVVITCLAVEEILTQLDSIEELDGLDCYIEKFVDQVTEESNVPKAIKTSVQKIPKKIHYCWFGGNPLPEESKKCIESWKKYCPDYEIIRWDESNYDIEKNCYMKQAYEAKKWAFVSDYARVDILYNEGGIYLDTDVELVASFDEFLQWDLFCGFEQQKLVNWGLGFGAIKGHRILKSVMEVYDKMSFIKEDGTLNMITCPVIQSEILKSYGFEMKGEFQEKNNVAIYPRDYFSPYPMYKCFGQVTKNTHSIHHFVASWHGDESKKARVAYEKSIIQILQHNVKNMQDCDFSEMNKEARIKKYQIWENLSESNTAGSKAPRDVRQIAGRLGYQTITIHPYKGQKGDSDWEWSHQRLKKEWEACYEIIEDNSILLLQHPFWQDQKERTETLLKLKEQKNIKIISLIHDVEPLRETYLSDYMKEEFDFMLKIADVLIVHNERMRDYFIGIGVKESAVITLDVFDYLSDELLLDKKYEKSITVAGNLDVVKAPYIEQLGQISAVKVHLYGPNYRNKAVNNNSNITYHGVFPPEQLISVLDRGFGLVWDGDSISTCSGKTGKYLKYNNPHKLSLYLAVGLPVVIWKEAAEAEYVEKNGVGICINSLYELTERLNAITEDEYAKFLKNIKVISVQIRNGEYTARAIQKAETLFDNLND